MTQRKAKQKYYYDKHARYIKEMAVGDAIMMMDGKKWKPGKVIAISQGAPRSYVIKTPEGQTYRRNRRHLRRVSNDKKKQASQLMTTTCLMTLAMNMKTLPITHQQLKQMQMTFSNYKQIHQ